MRYAISQPMSIITDFSLPLLEPDPPESDALPVRFKSDYEKHNTFLVGLAS